MVSSSGRATHDSAVCVEDEDSGRPHHVEPSHQVELGLGVDIDVHDAVDHSGDLAEQLTRRTARLAERG